MSEPKQRETAQNAVRPWVWAVFALVVALAGWRVYVARSGAVPSSADEAKAPVWQSSEGVAGGVEAGTTTGGRTVSRARRMPSDRRTLAMLRGGKVRKLSGGETALGRDPQVMAEFYEDAPPEAVEKLKEILASGSNEDRAYVRSEQFTPEVIERVRQLAPGELGDEFARSIEAWNNASIADRYTVPMAFLESVGPGGFLSYQWMYPIPPGEVPSPNETPVADTKWGTVVVTGTVPLGSSQVAIWAAHRLAAGDEHVELPTMPPPGFRTITEWIAYERSDGPPPG